MDHTSWDDSIVGADLSGRHQDKYFDPFNTVRSMESFMGFVPSILPGGATIYKRSTGVALFVSKGFSNVAASN